MHKCHRVDRVRASLSARRAWIEMVLPSCRSALVAGSLSARRAWIEIRCCSYPAAPRCVALRKESVDRNFVESWILEFFAVVALRKESVDRNAEAVPAMTKQAQSLSARRAWIEIALLAVGVMLAAVALRKESVDRNKYVVQCRKVMGVVALRKESVDRNKKA